MSFHLLLELGAICWNHVRVVWFKIWDSLNRSDLTLEIAFSLPFFFAVLFPLNPLGVPNCILRSRGTILQEWVTTFIQLVFLAFLQGVFGCFFACRFCSLFLLAFCFRFWLLVLLVFAFSLLAFLARSLASLLAFFLACGSVLEKTTKVGEQEKKQRNGKSKKMVWKWLIIVGILKKSTLGLRRWS